MKFHKNKIRILRIITRMNVGGPSKHVANLNNGLEELGCQTLLISGIPNSSEGDLTELALEKNIELIKFSHMTRSISWLNDLKTFVRLIIEIKKFKPHIVHTHTTKAGILGRAAALLCKTPLIFHTFHGHIFKNYYSDFISLLIITVERLFAKFTTKLITLTPNQNKEIKDILRISDSNKIVTIPLGLELDKYLQTPRNKNEWRKSMGFSNTDIVIGIVARLVPIKNHKLLINSMKSLVAKHSNLHLVIIGSGELETELKEQTNSLGLNNNVHFCGIIKKLEKVYSDLDLLVLCSKNEGTPVAIIEALSAGCPVASTNVGGVSEVLMQGKLGKLLSLDERLFTEELSETISEIKENRFIETPTMQTRHEICQKYSVKKLVDNIFNLYSNNIDSDKISKL